MVTYNCDGTTSCSIAELPEVVVTARDNNDKQVASSVSDGVGGLGIGLESITKSQIVGLAMQADLNGSLTDTKANRLAALGKMSQYGKTIGNLGSAGTFAIGAYAIGVNAYYEGGFGTYTQRAAARTLGGWGGAWAGAKAGAAGGAFFGGWGAIPGAIIGGVGGGLAGSYLLERGVQQFQ